MDAFEQEQQQCFDEAALEDWLRRRGGQPWFEGIVLKCLQKFPRLNEFQVTAVILKLRDEDAILQEEAHAKKNGADFDIAEELRAARHTGYCHRCSSALEDWLRSRGDQPWFEGRRKALVAECLQRFPRIRRFDVVGVIWELMVTGVILHEENTERLRLFQPTRSREESREELDRRMKALEEQLNGTWTGPANNKEIHG